MIEILIKVLKLVAVQLFIWGAIPIIIKLDAKLNKSIPLGHYKEATILETFILSAGIFLGWLLAF